MVPLHKVVPVSLNRLKYDVKSRRIKFSVKKEALSLENMAEDSNIRAVSRLNLQMLLNLYYNFIDGGIKLGRAKY